MSDQQRWFKLWHSALSDDKITALSPALRWAWAAFGAHTKVHGTSGRVLVNPQNATLAASMGVETNDLEMVIRSLPHLCVEEGKKCNGEITVTWSRWRYFQEDSTVSERVTRLRSKRRGEENRSEEKRDPPPGPPRKSAGEKGATSAGEALKRPQLPTEYVLSCAVCTAMLRALNEGSARCYTAPGRAGEWMHQAHRGRSREEVLGAIRRQVEALATQPGKSRFLSPSVMFKPENWDTTVNDRGRKQRVLLTADLLGEKT